MAEALRTRVEAQGLEAQSALGVWAEAYQALPTVVLGYSRPTGAEGWPFVAVEPLRDRRDLRRGHGLELALGLVCGYRLPSVGRGDALGLRAVDALAEAVLAAIARPWRVQWAGRWWDASVAARTGALASHPAYELELVIDFVAGTL